jgi:uncharacterized caspase-like protein
MSRLLPSHLLASFAWLALLIVPLAAGKQPSNKITQQGKKVALLVAVNDCNHDRFAVLQFAENDIEELAALLLKSGYSEVRVLSASRGKKNAKDAPTAANIRAAFASLIAGRGRHDTVLIALAGHGAQVEVNDPDGEKPARSFGYFCPADADLTGIKYRGHAPRLILFDQLCADLGRCGAGTRLLLVDAGRLRASRRNWARGMACSSTAFWKG